MIIGQDKGRNAYDDQRYNDARIYYQDILLERKNDNAAKFGLGVTAYKQKDIETALSALNDAKNSEDSKLASKAYYNLGNMLREQNKIDDGLAFYKKAIELDPNDQDAKINFELLKQIVQQQEQEQRFACAFDGMRVKWKDWELLKSNQARISDVLSKTSTEDIFVDKEEEHLAHMDID